MRAACVAGVLILVSCAGWRHEQRTATTPTPDPAEAAGERPGLHNVHEFAPGVYSGSQPHGPEGFESLREMGVKTILSVDGAPPEVEMAGETGMRYAHIPIQYAGISTEERLALAGAVRDLPRPIYVHCHHGKHRGPAAAAYALVATGERTAEEGTALLELAGTSRVYAGLWSCVGQAGPLSDELWALAPAEIPEVAEVSGMVGAMAMVDRHYDHLKSLAGNSWRAPAEHPDLVASNEAGIVENHLRACLSMPEVEAEGPGFVAMMRESAAHAAALEAALLAGSPEAGTWFGLLGASCNACHDQHRNAALP